MQTYLDCRGALRVHVVPLRVGGIIGAVLYHLIHQPATAAQVEEPVVAAAPVSSKTSTSQN